jgi:hypothetical protein
LGGSLSAAEVLGSGAIAQATEVHDPTNVLARRHLREVRGAAAFALLEVPLAATAHCVDEVVGDVYSLSDSAQRLRIQNVAFAQLDAAIGKRPRP